MCQYRPPAYEPKFIPKNTKLKTFMKLKRLLIILLLSACNQKKFSGYVKDFDSNKPVSNVWINISSNKTQTDSSGYFSLNVNSKSSCVLKLRKEGYAVKQIIVKADFGERNSYNKEKGKVIYMFKNESDFSNKRTSE